MTTSTAPARFDLDSFRQFLAQRDEPSWLGQLRQEGWARFSELGLPDRKHEEWQRTDIRALKLDTYGPAIEANKLLSVPTSLLGDGLTLAGQTTSVNGQAYSTTPVSESLRAQGVIFGSMDQLLGEHGELIRRHLGRALPERKDKFSSLNQAFWSGGHFLYVPRGVRVADPWLMFSVLGKGQADLGRSLIVLEDDAEATVLAETASTTPDATGLHCGAVEVIVGPRARLQYVNFQNWSTATWHFAEQHALVQTDGRLHWTVGALGSRLAKVNQHVALTGAGAEAQVNGVMFTEGKQHLAYHTLQHHQAPHCKSDFLYKGALQDAARIVWRGMIKVDPNAQKTDGYQRNDNLMLSNHARSDSIPGLEIEADDVRCTHGSTTGRVDDEQIFYCGTRGLTRKEAVRMIVAGFFQQVFDRISIESVREALGRAITDRVREYQ